MSPDAQHLERYFTQSSPGQAPPIDVARYREELKDFTSFFEKLTSLDTMDWFATDEQPARAPAPQAAPTAGLQASEPATASHDDETDAAPAPTARGMPAQTLAATVAPVHTPATATQPEADAADSDLPAAFPPAPAYQPPAPRMHVFHSGQASGDAQEAGMIGFDARAILSDARHGSPFRGFLGRVQLVLLVALGATLLFAMGLGMGALVLSLPREAAFGDHQSLVTESQAPESAVAEAKPAAVAAATPVKTGPGAVNLPVYAGGDAKSVPVSKTAAAPASLKVAQPAAAANSAGKPAAISPGKPAVEATTPAASSTASVTAIQSTTTVSAPAVATNGAPAQSVPAANPAQTGAAAPLTASPPQPAPAQEAAPAHPDEASFALQVGACTSYACVEQFRNLLLAEVESNRIKVISAGEGGQAIQRVRIEPLTRDAALKLKDALAAKDARFASSYLVGLH